MTLTLIPIPVHTFFVFANHLCTDYIHASYVAFESWISLPFYGSGPPQFSPTTLCFFLFFLTCLLFLHSILGGIWSLFILLDHIMSMNCFFCSSLTFKFNLHSFRPIHSISIPSLHVLQHILLKPSIPSAFSLCFSWHI